MQQEGKNELCRLGEAIRLHRKALKISQEDFAELAGLHRTYIGQVERGEKNISFINILRIAKALKVKPAHLFSESKL